MASLWAGSDPKPERRVRASQSDWSDIHQHFNGAWCVSCGRPYESLHHILPRSQGGDDLVVNLAPLCGSGTTGCHGLLETHAPGWERAAAKVRVYVLTNRERCVYMKSKVSWEAFDKRYPLLSEPDGENRAPARSSSQPSGSESDWDDKRKSPWEVDDLQPWLGEL